MVAHCRCCCCWLFVSLCHWCCSISFFLLACDIAYVKPKKWETSDKKAFELHAIQFNAKSRSDWKQIVHCVVILLRLCRFWSTSCERICAKWFNYCVSNTTIFDGNFFARLPLSLFRFPSVQQQQKVAIFAIFQRYRFLVSLQLFQSLALYILQNTMKWNNNRMPGISIRLIIIIIIQHVWRSHAYAVHMQTLLTFLWQKRTSKYTMQCMISYADWLSTAE